MRDVVANLKEEIENYVSEKQRSFEDKMGRLRKHSPTQRPRDALGEILFRMGKDILILNTQN